MRIDTTITITRRAKNRLIDATGMTGKTISSLLIACMQQLAKNHCTHIRLDGRVQYRKRETNACCWQRHHVRASSRDYDMFIDLRKVCKRSVSLLVDIAIESYLSEVIEGFTGKDKCGMDNYPYHHYVIIGETIENVVCWRIYWGFPENLQL